MKRLLSYIIMFLAIVPIITNAKMNNEEYVVTHEIPYGDVLVSDNNILGVGKNKLTGKYSITVYDYKLKEVAVMDISSTAKYITEGNKLFINENNKLSLYDANTLKLIKSTNTIKGSLTINDGVIYVYNQAVPDVVKAYDLDLKHLISISPKELVKLFKNGDVIKHIGNSITRYDSNGKVLSTIGINPKEFKEIMAVHNYIYIIEKNYIFVYDDNLKLVNKLDSSNYNGLMYNEDLEEVVVLDINEERGNHLYCNNTLKDCKKINVPVDPYLPNTETIFYNNLYDLLDESLQGGNISGVGRIHDKYFYTSFNLDSGEYGLLYSDLDRKELHKVEYISKINSKDELTLQKILKTKNGFIGVVTPMEGIHTSYIVFYNLKYNVDSANGVVTNKSQVLGDEVYVNTNEAKGMKANIVVTDTEGNTYTVKDNKFVMPCSDVVVDISYVKDSSSKNSGNYISTILYVGLGVIVGVVVVRYFNKRKNKNKVVNSNNNMNNNNMNDMNNLNNLNNMNNKK